MKGGVLILLVGVAAAAAAITWAVTRRPSSTFDKLLDSGPAPAPPRAPYLDLDQQFDELLGAAAQRGMRGS